MVASVCALSLQTSTQDLSMRATASISGDKIEEAIPKSKRALIGMTGLGNRKKGIVKAVYKFEDNEATEIFQRTSDAYATTIILAKKDSTFQNFVQAIYDLENDSSIEAIDVVMNMHGQPGFMCFWEDGDVEHCTPMEEIASVIKQIPSGDKVGPRKLRALYTDACHSLSQLDYWQDMGFKVTAGTKEYDVNHTSDIRKFSESWVRGRTFERSIRKANSFNLWEVSTNVLNRTGIVKKIGDSTKVIQGDATLTISSEF